MRRLIVNWLAPLAVAGTLAVSPAHAQDAEGTGSGRSAPAFQYFVALLATALIMVTVCKPTRKNMR